MTTTFKTGITHKTIGYNPGHNQNQIQSLEYEIVFISF